MSRHSRNNTAGAFFTYYERRLAAADGNGTLEERLGSHSLRRFEQCWLCLLEAKLPVASPDGIIFCRDCIVVNLAEQRRKSREARLREAKTQAEDKAERFVSEVEKKTAEVDRFLEASAGIETIVKTPEADQIQTLELKKKRQFADIDSVAASGQSFWTEGSLRPLKKQALDSTVSRGTLCPITGRALKFKELIEVHPQCEAAEGGNRWLCAICFKIIVHQPAVVLKSTGQVMLKTCALDFVVGHRGALEGREVTLDDLLPLKPGGTGFSSHNPTVSRISRPALM
ncbi:MAG: hypothetical protein KVP17_001392 [Porospora cf. gigantea B]|uniref:uncharacterized protein n=1 Tax=Porospora cf. gigantea B TaxID=2853592 RepID=UPI003571FBE5|nr:MAG: hypothetical protein KVP17_001392 [Porospora cf. gigantea B]